MEFIARCINDEDIFESWLMCGVPDGDIPLGCMDTSYVDDYFLTDNNLSELMGLFLRCMKRAEKSGGLYIDKVVSK